MGFWRWGITINKRTTGLWMCIIAWGEEGGRGLKYINYVLYVSIMKIFYERKAFLKSKQGLRNQTKTSYDSSFVRTRVKLKRTQHLLYLKSKTIQKRFYKIEEMVDFLF